MIDRPASQNNNHAVALALQVPGGLLSPQLQARWHFEGGLNAIVYWLGT